MIALCIALSSLALAQEPPVEAPPEGAPPVEAPPEEAPSAEPPAEPEPAGLPPEEGAAAADPVSVAPGLLASSDEPQPAPLSEPPEYEPDPGRVAPRRFGLSVEYGWLTNRDPAARLFSEGPGMNSFGFGLGYRLTHNLVAVGSWHHVRQGTDVHIENTDTTADFQNRQQSFRAALVANEVTFGARVDVPIVDTFFPFISGQGELVTTWARFDDVLDDRENPTQAEAQGLHLGGMVAGGGEVRLIPEGQVQFSMTLELGYAWLSRSELGAFGEMKPGGFVARTGCGVRF